MKLSRLFTAAGLIAAVWFLGVATPGVAWAQPAESTVAKTILTVVPHGSSEESPTIASGDVKIRVNGRSAETESITPLRGDRAGMQLVILIDSAARTSLGRETKDIADFVKSLPPTTEVAIAYMMNGRAVFAQPFTVNKELALRGLHLPGGSTGSSASPYFCISELAKNWPSKNVAVRRAVVAITDGIDPYEVRFDPEDPYVHEAITDAVRNGVTVNAIYWHDDGLASRIGFLTNGGQSLLGMVASDTGGRVCSWGVGKRVWVPPIFHTLN